MRTRCFIVLLVLLSLLLTSCNDTRIADIDGIIWKSDIFNIVATSEQLQSIPPDTSLSESDYSKYCSMIEFDGKYQYCRIGLANNIFSLQLVNPSTYTTVFFYGECYDLIWGYYDELVKIEDANYRYLLEIELIDGGQYYEYCQANGLDFPKKITLYGYVDE